MFVIISVELFHLLRVPHVPLQQSKGSALLATAYICRWSPQVSPDYPLTAKEYRAH
jgi:hypothetical protein